MTNMNMAAVRPYRMTARASSAALTHAKILDAAVAAFWDNPAPTVSLDDVARRAGVTVQTVIRRFGDKGGLMAAAGERESARIRAQRDPAKVVGNPVAAVDQLVSHYEEMGLAVLRMLAAESQTPELTPLVDTGRRTHRAWCEAVFGGSVRVLDRRRRRRRLAAIAAVCDIQMWKLLRLDAGLSEKETRLALLEMLRPLLEVS